MAPDSILEAVSRRNVAVESDTGGWAGVITCGLCVNRGPLNAIIRSMFPKSLDEPDWFRTLDFRLELDDPNGVDDKKFLAWLSEERPFGKSFLKVSVPLERERRFPLSSASCNADFEITECCPVGGLGSASHGLGSNNWSLDHGDGRVSKDNSPFLPSRRPSACSKCNDDSTEGNERSGSAGGVSGSLSNNPPPPSSSIAAAFSAAGVLGDFRRDAT